MLRSIIVKRLVNKLNTFKVNNNRQIKYSTNDNINERLDRIEKLLIKQCVFKVTDVPNKEIIKKDEPNKVNNNELSLSMMIFAGFVLPLFILYVIVPFFVVFFGQGRPI